MFFLALKKAFFDAWDNLGSLIVGNLSIFLVVTAGLWPIFKILETGSSAGLILLIPVIPAIFIMVGVLSALMSRVADFKRVTWSEIPEIFKSTWKGSLLISLVTSGFFSMSVFGMIYYSSMKSILGLTAMALLFWISVGVYLTLIWFFPVRNRLTGGFRKSLKKSALIMFDNLFLSIYLGFLVVPAQIFLWPLTAFAAFGPAGIQLYLNTALRLLIFKYDWLEEHSEAKRKDVPWYEILVDEKERVGKRTLKGMIFPWKE
jgi:hypothetical protein